MDFWVLSEKRQKQIDEERQRLLSISDAEAEKLSSADQYQRMRFQREIEAAEWLAEVRRKLPPATEAPVKKRYSKKSPNSWSD